MPVTTALHVDLFLETLGCWLVYLSTDKIASVSEVAVFSSLSEKAPLLNHSYHESIKTLKNVTGQHDNQRCYHPYFQSFSRSAFLTYQYSPQILPKLPDALQVQCLPCLQALHHSL